MTFCVLNLVVAIILNAFTWCYSLEPSEITSGLFVNSQHLIHFGVRSLVLCLDTAALYLVGGVCTDYIRLL